MRNRISTFTHLRICSAVFAVSAVNEMFDNCRESSINSPFLCKTKPISEKAK